MATTMRTPMQSLLQLLGLLLLEGWMATRADGAGPALRLPLDCEVPGICQVQNHFDHDPGGAFRDFACGHLGYDGHDGVDLRLPNLAHMAAGVAVLAAAPGRVRAVRDGMADISVKDLGREAIRGREAGNGVVIRHDADWETQYSHLRRDSLRVKPGDPVQAGQVLGLVGLSGNTEFPHLHFEVRYRGRPVDPFVGLTAGEPCAPGVSPLWDDAALKALTYRPTGLLQAGFAARAPELRAVERGELGATSLAADAPILAFWVESFGIQAGDEEILRLFAPDGNLLAEKRLPMTQSLARRFGYIGRKRSMAAWPEGEYRGRYVLKRGKSGTPIIELERVLRVR